MSKVINHLKHKLAAGAPVIGTAVTMPSPQLMRALIECGFDWLMIDLEHGSIGPESTQAMINATQGSGCVPLVRLPAGDAWMSKMPLDAGAMGLFFPLIMNAKDADKAIKSAMYPPVGNRGFGPIHASYHWRSSMTEYASEVDDAILKIIMIEHIDAVNQLEEILNVPNIDIVFIAPYDLSQSLDLAGQFDHPVVKKVINQAEHAVKAAGLYMGGYAGTPEKGHEMLNRGYNLLMLGYDGLLIESGITPLLNALSK